MPGITAGTQTIEFLCACGLGFLLGLYYALFRTIRLILPPSAGVCIFQDVFFCVTSALVTFFAFLGLSDGILHPYLIIGETLGFFVFLGSLGNVIHTLLATCYAFLVRLSDFVTKRFVLPIFRVLKGVARKIKTVLEKIVKKRKKHKKSQDFFQKNLEISICSIV